MSNSYVYETPQYFDFEGHSSDNEDIKRIEAYFDYDHENPDSYYVDCGEENCSAPEDDYNSSNHGLRKSLSVPCLTQDTKLKSERSEKNHLTKGSTCSLYEKGTYSQKKLLPGKNKYVSTAEAIRNFYRRTPDRYHSKSKNEPPNLTKSNGPISVTIPQSPAFATKKRCRPVTVMSREEKELKEFEEAQKHQIKANPVNMKILQAPFKPKASLVKKPSTTFVPFKITEVQKAKPSSPKEGLYEFRAKPVPKSVYELKLPLKKSILCTQPLTPSFVKKFSEKMKQAQANLQKEKEVEKRELENKNQKLSRTRPEPFSFEKRDQYQVKKKEEFVRKVIEEEKKQREFLARPFPKEIFTSQQIKTNRCSMLLRGSVESLRSMKSDDDNLAAGSTVFKARPAKVLSKEPFVPKKEERPLVEITEFQLNTNRRAKERDDYEKKLREKHEYVEEVNKQREEEKRLKEEEERAFLRKQMEHVAKPIRHYKKVLRISPKPLTQPCSPKLHKPRLRNQENMVNASNL